MTFTARRGSGLLFRAVLFFLVWWSFAPFVLFDYQRKWQFIESCTLGVLAALIPWRRSWRDLRARFDHSSR